VRRRNAPSGSRALLATAAAAGALGGAPASGLAARPPSCPAPAIRQRASADLAFARRRYRLEAGGAAVRAALHRVVADRALTGALAAGRLAAASAAAQSLLRRHLHLTAIRAVRGGRVVLATKTHPFDVAGAGQTVRGGEKLEVTIQDLIGFIRLVHKFTGAEVVVRGAAGEVESSLPAALGARLPAGGCAALGGRAYAVRSFAATAFAGEPLTISVLRG
jgi:hypothetical protein